jgi:hypothetical protein
MDLITGECDFTITWNVADDGGISKQDVLLSTDGGATFSPIVTGLAGTVTQYNWVTLATVNNRNLRVRVVAYDNACNSASDDSDASFQIVNIGSAALLAGPAVNGGLVAMLFVYSEGRLTRIAGEGNATPIGGTFSTLEDPDLIERLLFVRPRVNNHGAVAFKAKVDGARTALFPASPGAMVKVVATGDQLDGGATVRLIDTFALNDRGQVSFFAYGRADKTRPLGVFVATPRAPQIAKVKLKRPQGALELRVNGAAMIANDSVIEIDGVPLGALDYPAGFRQDGGTTAQVTSRDARLEQLLPAGRTARVTVYNPLTNQRSAPRPFVR